MEADSNSINLFTTRVRQMILQYNELKERNTALQATIDSQLVCPYHRHAALS